MQNLKIYFLKSLFLILAGSSFAKAGESIEYFSGEHKIFGHSHSVLVKRIFLDLENRLPETPPQREERSELLYTRIDSSACVVKNSTLNFQSDESEWVSKGNTYSFWINYNGDGSDSAEGVILNDGTQIIEWSHHAREGAVTSVSHEVLHPVTKGIYEASLGFSRDCL